MEFIASSSMNNINECDPSHLMDGDTLPQGSYFIFLVFIMCDCICVILVIKVFWLFLGPRILQVVSEPLPGQSGEIFLVCAEILKNVLGGEFHRKL